MFLPVGVENIPQNPLEAAQAQAVPHTVPLAWQSIGHGLLQLLPALAQHSQPLPAPVGPTCPCHPLCCDILTPQDRGHCPAQPFPCQPLPIPARSQGHTGNPSQLPPASPGLKAALVWRATESLPSHIQPVGRAPAVPGKQ